MSAQLSTNWNGGGGVSARALNGVGRMGTLGNRFVDIEETAVFHKNSAHLKLGGFFELIIMFSVPFLLSRSMCDPCMNEIEIHLWTRNSQKEYGKASHPVGMKPSIAASPTECSALPFLEPTVLCVRIRADAPLWKVLTGPGRCGGGAGTPCMTESFLLLD